VAYIDFRRHGIQLALLILLAGCLRIPTGHQTLGSPAAGNAAFTPAGRCSPGLLASLAPQPPLPLNALGAGGFTLVCWNIVKGSRPGCYADLAQLVTGGDIVLLQEAKASRPLMQLMDDLGAWDLAPAFYHGHRPVGVLTAARIAPGKRCMARTPEPLLRLPKSMLITSYTLTRGSPPLVVANLHGVNFAWGTVNYRKFWQAVERFLAPHGGPMIVAGDFNTWSKARLAVVSEAMAHLGLAAVPFKEGARSIFWGHAVDHVYYRGLMPVKARVAPVGSSDHRPLVVTFQEPAAP